MAENERRDTASSKEGEAWGTLEELLLACAVGRHGTESWDSIAMEVQKRTNSGNRKDGENYDSNFSNAFTPRNCEQRYDALKRRFNVTGGGERSARTAVDGEADEVRERLSFMVDELRKLRVEELRRELERHDVSIVSLQLKVKSLEEEREKSSSKAEPEAGGTDLATRADRSDADEQRVGEPDRYSAEVAGDPVSSGRSDEPEDRSFNESNSTSHKGAPAEGRKSNQKRESDEDRNSEPDPVLPAAEFALEKDCSSSLRGGDGGYGLEEGKVVGRTSPPVRLGNSGELRESVSESKREGKESEAKQSSDVQSSASLSRRKRRGWRRGDGVGVGVGNSGDEMEAEELSPANRRTAVKSQPLIKFLEIVRSHKHGLVFQRRLPSQETEKYRSLIRQHMDLETVQSKLDRGVYCECHPRFYCDILLVFTNAILFFCKSSTEHAAARELRKLVMKEIATQQVARKPKPQPKPAPLVKPDLESQILDTVVKKPRSSTNIVVCRRRTNSSALKPSSLSLEKNTSIKKEEEVKIEKVNAKPPSVNQKKDDRENEEQKKSNLSGRSLGKTTTTSNNNASSGNRKSKGAVQQGESNNSNNASGSNNSKKSNKDESSDEEDQPINKRRKQLVSSRKQGVVNFLKRMKQNSPSKEALAKPNTTEEPQEAEKAKKAEIGKKKVAVGKKKDGDDGQAKRRVSGRRPTKGEEVEKPETTKRGSGRPPTRKAAVGGGGTPDSGPLKRGREGEKEAGGSGKNTVAKKRTRR